MIFSVQIDILDYNTQILNIDGNYDIDIYAIPSETLIGFSTVTTSLGIAKLAGLYFTVGGDYYIITDSSNFGTWSSNTFTIKETILKVSFTSNVVNSK